MCASQAIDFFDAQFHRQVLEHDFALNPFERHALAYLKGSVLDLGAGLGNLSLEAGRRGHEVIAVDASATAVARINEAALAEGLPVRAIHADVGCWPIDRIYDTIVAIGLLMFFRRARALELLGAMQDHVGAGGRIILNVLIEGTTFMAMFDPDDHYLFRRGEVEALFEGWSILSAEHATYPAPGGTRKDFVTVIAQKPQ